MMNVVNLDHSYVTLSSQKSSQSHCRLDWIKVLRTTCVMVSSSHKGSTLMMRFSGAFFSVIFCMLIIHHFPLKHYCSTAQQLQFLAVRLINPTSRASELHPLELHTSVGWRSFTRLCRREEKRPCCEGCAVRFTSWPCRDWIGTQIGSVTFHSHFRIVKVIIRALLQRY